MFLYLVHHGDAVDPAVDPQRPLSDRGHGSAERLAADAAGRGVKPSVIWHSGKLRARQTAEIFRRSCAPAARCAAVRGLQPTDAPDWIVDLLAGETDDTMLVGHLPNLPRVLARLLGAPVDQARFPQHGLVALARVTNGWEERWRLAPMD